jgi:hypothetical protein
MRTGGLQKSDGYYCVGCFIDTVGTKLSGIHTSGRDPQTLRSRKRVETQAGPAKHNDNLMEMPASFP